MELTAVITLGVFVAGASWRVLSKIDKSAAETQGEIKSNRVELTDRF